MEGVNLIVFSNSSQSSVYGRVVVRVSFGEVRERPGGTNGVRGDKDMFAKENNICRIKLVLSHFYIQ